MFLESMCKQKCLILINQDAPFSFVHKYVNLLATDFIPMDKRSSVSRIN